jgi:hypothetical protein
MPDSAIRVDNLSKLYYLGALHQRPDTLRDALTGFLPLTSRRITRIKDKNNPSNPPIGQWQAPPSPDDLWALKDVSFDACPAPLQSLHSFRLRPGCCAAAAMLANHAVARV